MFGTRPLRFEKMSIFCYSFSAFCNQQKTVEALIVFKPKFVSTGANFVYCLVLVQFFFFQSLMPRTVTFLTCEASPRICRRRPNPVRNLTG